MNPFLNPLNTLPVLKYFFTDPNRIWRLKPEKMKKYRDKAFRNIVKYAYTVPLYYNKYKKAGIHPNDIRGIDDIVKFPFITKDDLIEHFPDGIIPPNYSKEKAQVNCTGGTSGKPVCIFYDFPLNARSWIIGLRDIRFHNLHWRKSRFAVVGEFGPKNRIGSIYENHFLPYVKFFHPLNNLLYIDLNGPMEETIKKLEAFNPDTIHSYPSGLQHLAYFKRIGYGKNLKPKLLTVSGSVLDDYTRKYVEDAFGCKIFNIYTAVEAGTAIALECIKGTWHINYDFFHLETIDENREIVPPGKRGQTVLTRLWGTGTPIIRYIGVTDLITLTTEEQCDCGLNTPVIVGGVEGKMRADIVLPNGKILPSSAYGSLAAILYELKTFKVKQYQIVQKAIDKIDILIVIDDDLRNVGPSIEVVFKRIKDVYQQVVGPDVEINVKEVKEIKGDPSSPKPPPIVISHVKPEEGYKLHNQ